MLKLTYKEILTKKEAITLGKDRGWCTATNGGHYYDTTYASYYGRLFVLFEKPRPRAQYQIFFSNNGGTELRAKFNKFLDPNTFFFNEGECLLDWYNETKIYQPTIHNNMTATEVRLRNQEFGRALREDNSLINIAIQNRIAYQDEYEGFSGIPNEFPPNVDRDIVDKLNIYEKRYEPIFKVKLVALANRVINIHMKNEMPEARQVESGSIFNIAEGGIILLRTVDSRDRPIYLVAEQSRHIINPASLDTINIQEPQSINYQDRKIELTLIVKQRYFNSFQKIANIKEIYRSGSNEETIECEIRYEESPSITF